MLMMFNTHVDQEDIVSDHESAISVEEGSSSAGGTGADARNNGGGGGGGGDKKQKNQKKKFDISLPAQHLVSSNSNLDKMSFNNISLPLPPIVPW
jgi:hypothetical protein